jgi:hypothetical protein
MRSGEEREGSTDFLSMLEGTLWGNTFREGSGEMAKGLVPIKIPKLSLNVQQVLMLEGRKWLVV